MVDQPRNAPGPRGDWLLGSTLDFKDSPLEYANYVARAYGDVARMRIGTQQWYLLAHPEAVYDACVTQAHIFLKPSIARKLWRPFLGERSVLTSEGEVWKRQSRLMRPAFHRDRIDAYAEVMRAATDRMLDGWAPGERRNGHTDMMGLTLDIVAKTLFDADISGEARTFGAALEELQHVILDHLYMPLPIPRWWPSRKNRRKWGAIDTMRGIVQRVVDDRRSTGEDRGDLLSMLIAARDADGSGLSDDELLDQAMTLFFAGHETTANSLVWAWYALARHPEVTARLQADLDRVLGGRPCTVADLEQLPYLEQVVKESMRWIPSVWVFMKEPVEDTVLRGVRIPKGAQVMISPWVLHRDARWFPAPTRFDPERFTPENEKKIPRGAYLPFSGGSRVCMGKSFAMMEARIILATMLQRVDAVVPADWEPQLFAELSLHPRGGLPIDVAPRVRRAAA